MSGGPFIKRPLRATLKVPSLARDAEYEDGPFSFRRRWIAAKATTDMPPVPEPETAQ